jgi:aminocarboxymuconate-semialdehyde decarboxylase
MRIDFHAHVVPAAYLDRVRQRDVPDVTIERHGDAETLVVAGGGDAGPVAQRISLIDAYHDPKARLHAMDAARVDVHVISPVQFMYHYWNEPRAAAELTRLVNDGLDEMVRAAPDRLVAMATVPLQDPRAAVVELDRVHSRGVRAVEIGTHIAGTPLDDPALDVFWARAEALGTALFVHPYAPLAPGRLGAYFLRNLLGNPFETAVAMSRLFFGGVLDRFPRVKLCFAHGGGAVPFVIGRLTRGFEVAAACRERARAAPRAYLDRVWYDTILHDAAALAYLVSTVGPSRLVMGSDYPFDIGDLDPVGTIDRLDLDTDARAAMLGGNAARLLGLPS